MNKIINRSLVLFATVALLQGCKKDSIELAPEYQLDALNNPRNIDQVEQVLIGGAYTGLRNANYYGSGSGTGGGWSLMPDVLSDNLYETTESLANSRIMADFLYNPNTAQIGTFYTAPASVIANANIVLRDIDKYTTPANQKRANRIKGQALGLRALAHFDLFRYFAPKFDRNSNDPAIPYTKSFVAATSFKATRLTNKDFYDNLFADLTQAVTLLSDVDKPVNPATGSVRPYFDLATAYALQARAYLYASQFAEAETAATNVINLRPLVVLDQAAFSGMYNQTARGEIIFNVQFEAGQSGPTFLVFFATNNRSYFRPAPEVATVAGNTGLIQSNDIRYNAYFSTIGGGLALTKYKGKNTASDGNANFPVFRTGEMYLIRAEARARQAGKEVLGLADLNTLRAARIPGVSALVLTGQPLLDAIANERRAELIGEGHRFFDLKRTSRTLQRGSVCGTSTSVAGTCSLPPTAREWALPFPEAVINPNPAIGQNPGY